VYPCTTIIALLLTRTRDINIFGGHVAFVEQISDLMFADGHVASRAVILTARAESHCPEKSSPQQEELSPGSVASEIVKSCSSSDAEISVRPLVTRSARD